MNNYGYDLRDFSNKKDICVSLLANYLNNGSLSLLLGAGASSGFGLPGWIELVERCAINTVPGFVPQSAYSHVELKELMDKVKKLKPIEYIDIVHANLYKNIVFDFSLVRKDLLIAITSLIIGRSRGNIRNIITYNFDNVLEWYLTINGLKTKVTTFENLMFSSPDVDIMHIHGYIPISDDYGSASNELVFSKKEFEDRMIGSSYWKEMMYDFFRENIFLAIGLSPESLIDDICPYLRYLNNWYEKEKIPRTQPYGFAFLTPSDFANNNMEELLEHGIIPCIIDKDIIPLAIFDISQTALKN